MAQSRRRQIILDSIQKAIHEGYSRVRLLFTTDHTQEIKELLEPKGFLVSNRKGDIIVSW